MAHNVAVVAMTVVVGVVEILVSIVGRFAAHLEHKLDDYRTGVL